MSLVFDASINDTNQIEGTVNNILTLTENATQGVADKGASIGQTLGTVIQLTLFIIVLAMVIALFPRIWRGLTGWVSAIKMPKS